jgi:hypothetical protein
MKVTSASAAGFGFFLYVMVLGEIRLRFTVLPLSSNLGNDVKQTG